MRFKVTLIVLGVFLLAVPAGAADAQFSKNKRDMQSYAMGVEMHRDFNRQGFDFDLDMVLRGMQDAAAGGKLLWSEETLTTTLKMTLAELKQKKEEATAGLSRQELGRRALIAQQDNNKKKREELLAENRMKGGEETQQSKNKRELQSYALGVEMLRNVSRHGFFDLDMVLQGFKDAAAGGKLQWSEETLTTARNMAVAELRYKRGQDRMILQRDNQKKGEEFLAANKTKEGVVALPSGLQYKIVEAADGRKPTDADTVEFRYRGTHIDGTEFDNSAHSGQPATLKKVSEVIPGWREALKLMSVGSKWQLFIPSGLAYGQHGAGHIGPYETTIYEIELVDIK